MGKGIIYKVEIYMFNVYMDSGTSNTRAYLLNDYELVETAHCHVGTKDSAISGNNDVLLLNMKECYDKLLQKSNLKDCDISEIWASGMVTNPFGVIEVEHVSTPITAKKLLEHVYPHYEAKYFNRTLNLIPGAKTAQKGQVVTIDNVSLMNNVRGEEIEAMGIISANVLPKNAVIICPGSHTHILNIVNNAITDIISNFTGELYYAIKKDTILGGELSTEDVKMDTKHVLLGYENLKKYGLSRALYIIHATKVFGTSIDEVRNSMLCGIICGSVIDVLKLRIQKDWNKVEKIVVVGEKNYITAYKLICEKIMPKIPCEIIHSHKGMSFALCGFFHLLKLKNEEQN